MYVKDASMSGLQETRKNQEYALNASLLIGIFQEKGGENEI